MTEEKKSMVPKLRFPGFNETWEQRKLEDCATIIMGQSPKSENYTNDPKDHILVQGNADLKNGQVAPRVWTTEATKIGKVGDIILSVRAPVGEVGKTAYDVVLGRGVAAIRGNDFLLQTLLKLKECKYWGKVSAGSTFDSITSEILKSTLISMPAIEEQIKIGDFLSSVDKLITLHQRKLEGLSKLKKSLLQKMFPKNGQQNPELRFPGFTEAWEQRKLKDVAEIVGGGTPSTSVPAYWNGSIDWYSPTEIGQENFAKGSKRKISNEGLNNSSAKLLPAHKTILFTSRATIGEAAILEREGATNQGFQSIVTKEGVDVYFLYSYKHHLKKQALIKASGSTFLEISKNEVEGLHVPVPSGEEQAKIGSFFKLVDKAITLHQRKLESLKKLKKSLLQQMFV